MVTIAHPGCQCNSPNPDFSGISGISPPSAPGWPGNPALRPYGTARKAPKPAFAPQPDRLPKGCRTLLDAIRSSLPAGQTSVTLQQNRLAATLKVSAVTVRRRTRWLQEQGLLLARRVRNSIVYTLAGVAGAAPPPPTEPAQATLPDMPPAAARPATPPIKADKITAKPAHTRAMPRAADPKPTAAPLCPAHCKSRVSWMSETLGATIHYCPATTGSTRHCSWLHESKLGQIHPPGADELNLEQITALISNPPAQTKELPETGAQPQPATAAEAPDRSPHGIWQTVTAAFRDRTPVTVPPCLDDARGVAYDGAILTVQTPNAAVKEYLQNNFIMRTLPAVAAAVVGHPVTVRYRCAEAPA